MKGLTRKGMEARNLNQVILISAWSFTIVVSSLMFLYVGRWLDVNLNTEPAFMIGLFILGIALCIARMYTDFKRTSDLFSRVRHHRA